MPINKPMYRVIADIRNQHLVTMMEEALCATGRVIVDYGNSATLRVTLDPSFPAGITPVLAHEHIEYVINQAEIPSGERVGNLRLWCGIIAADYVARMDLKYDLTNAKKPLWVTFSIAQAGEPPTDVCSYDLNAPDLTELVLWLRKYLPERNYNAELFQKWINLVRSDMGKNSGCVYSFGAAQPQIQVRPVGFGTINHPVS
jgi:hypothetical protein